MRLETQASASFTSRSTHTRIGIPKIAKITEDPELNPDVGVEYERCIRPRTVDEIWSHEYGARYPGPIWRTHEDKFAGSALQRRMLA